MKVFQTVDKLDEYRDLSTVFFFLLKWGHKEQVTHFHKIIRPAIVYGRIYASSGRMF